DMEALVTGWSSPPPTVAQLESATKLSLVVVIGASVRSVYPELLLSRNVTICNTADAIAESVAEHCLLLALAGLRQLTDVNQKMRRGDWPPRAATFGLQEIAKRAWRSASLAPFKPALRPVAATISRLGFGGAVGSLWSDLQGQTVGLIGWGHV